MMSLLALAQQHATRQHLAAECWRAWTAQGLYRDSHEELTLPRADPPSLMPTLAVALRLLLRPRAADAIVQGTEDSYALSKAAVRSNRELATRDEFAMRSAPTESRPEVAGAVQP